jgi:hypothetical protein
LKFNQYSKYFRSDSQCHLLQTGVYKGPDGIEEYMRFTVSKYFAERPWEKSEKSFIRYNEEKGECEFRSLQEGRLITSDVYTDAKLDITRTIMLKLYFNFQKNYITTMDLYFAPGYIGLVAQSITGVNSEDNICNMMAGPCNAIVTQHSDCRTKLANLPGSEGSLIYIDGNTVGCRALHAIFAETNPNDHCAHLSFEPLQGTSSSSSYFRLALICSLHS